MKLISLLIGLLSLTASASAQEMHSKAYIIFDHDSFVPDIRIGVHIDIDQGWHTYWENPGDVGSPPEMRITSSEPTEQSDINYPIPNRITAEPYDSYGYENETFFYRTLKLKDPGSKAKTIHLQIDADWLVCKELCVPASKQFTLDLPISSGGNANDEYFKFFGFPKFDDEIDSSISYLPDQTTITIGHNGFKKSQSVDFFPSRSMKGSFNKPLSMEITDGKAVFRYPYTKDQDLHVEGLVKLNSKTAYWVGRLPAMEQQPSKPAPSKHPRLAVVLILAFLGGILLNLMPCVLPVVSLKLLSLFKAVGEKKDEIRSSNLWYASGILISLLIFSFVFLGIQKTGESLGWGFQLQSPVFVSCLIILFFLIGLNLIGFFEISGIPIPGLGKLLAPRSRSADFLAGFFTTVVATPCTAPFMAVAIGYALTQNNWLVVATFFSLGLGLAFPYLILSAFPNLIRLLPKPGMWMITLKELLAFPMFLTVAWLTWVLTKLTSSESLFPMLVNLSLIVFFFWIQKRMSRGSFLKKVLLTLTVLAIILLTRFGLMENTTGGISWEPFDQKIVDDYAKSSIVFVDFTADWCVTCKANERVTFSNNDVLSIIKTSNIKMIRADWTKQDPRITAVLKRYDRAGVPFYLLYKPTLTTPMVLPTLLTPGIFIDAVQQGDSK